MEATDVTCDSCKAEYPGHTGGNICNACGAMTFVPAAEY